MSEQAPKEHHFEYCAYAPGPGNWTWVLLEGKLVPLVICGCGQRLNLADYKIGRNGFALAPGEKRIFYCPKCNGLRGRFILDGWREHQPGN